MPTTATSAAGATMTVQGDGSVLVGGLNPATDTYTVSAVTSLSEIPGIRLEVLEDPSLPGSGPGREPNGNFVLTDFVFDAAAVPAPASATLRGLGSLLLYRLSGRKR
jgi:hypothetical protein